MFFIKVLILCLTATFVTAKKPKDDKAVTPISIYGNKFVDSNGYEFSFRGIAYQRMRQEDDNFVDKNGVGYIDSMANTESCLRDLTYLQQLNVNVVRVYQVDPNEDHDTCMNAFAAKGIYVLCDLPEPRTSINRNQPSWDIELYDRYKSVIDTMHKYPNLLGFVAGNEVTNTVANVDASPFVKAAIRDSKNYMKEKSYRKIPVGYSGNDDARIRKNLANYFVCGEDEDAKADFLGVNMYEWCGYSTYSTSGYRDRTIEFSDYPIPIFFSEFGCNLMTPRPFTEIEALYGLTMSKVWSGGIAYEYFQHENNYGVVQENKDGTITPLDDFKTLSLRYGSNIPKKTKVKPNSYTNSTVKCEKSEYWSVSDELPNTPDRGKCECLQSTLSCIMTPFKEVHETNLLAEACSKVDCTEAVSDGSEGVYGDFSDCSLNQKVSFALDKYYKANGSKKSDCDFNDKAVLVTNNDAADLSTIVLKDGRTCKETLLNYTGTSKKKTGPNYKKNKGTGLFVQDTKNITQSMKSQAHFISYHTIGEFIVLFLSFRYIF